MAAPTNFRVEAQSMTTTVLRWDYSGSNQITVHRSTDGSSYSVVTTLTSTADDYTDTDLDAGTKYWYKVSDDAGSTFSDAATVYTHFCVDQSNAKAFQLPRFDEGQEDAAQKLNDLAERVEAALQGQQFPDSCIICPDDGAVVLDCTDSCNSFFIVADEDINSFTINRCGNSDPRIDIYVPPNTTVGICGFPPGYGFTGDECTEAPISGGTKGKTMSVGGGGAAGGGGGGMGKSTPGKPKTDSGPGTSSGSGGGIGGTECECVPGRNNELTLKCCSTDCSMKCSGTKKLNIKVCGGVRPYTFEHTGSVKFEKYPGGPQSDTVETPQQLLNPGVTVVPPTNTGSAVAGTAYKVCGKWRLKGAVACDACTENLCFSHAFGCDDVEDSCSAGTCSGADACSSQGSHCESGTTTCNTCGTDLKSGFNANSEVCSACSGDTMNDVRTAQMISDGCNPCGVQAGATVTVTDAAGVSVSITLKA